MASLRTTLEEAVVKKVFKDVVPRWSDHVLVTALKKVAWDNSLVDEIIELYEDLSRFIEGHFHSDEATGAPPQPSDLEERIAKADALLKRATPERRS
jgi:hypothetical protein